MTDIDSSTDTFADVDPATGETLARVPCTTDAQLDASVARARAAWPAWAGLSLEHRSALLLAGVEALGSRVDEVADLISREMGKPRGDALREVEGWVRHTPRVLEEVERALESQVLVGRGTETRLVRDPLGVVAAITPWNFPVSMPLELLLPALATGNTAVFKPSEHVPLTGAALAEHLATHLPDGVLELVQGAGDVGAALVDADVDMIAFVGSRATGKRIMEAAGRGLKRVVLELGGKDPLIVFDDADLEAAADCVVTHSLRNAGQVCCSVERVYAAEGVAERLEELVLERARDWRHGDPFDPEVRMGPMVSAAQRDVVASQVEDAVADGARLLLGGRAEEGPGSFFPPTVLADVPEDARLAREETFGPVVALARFDGSEEEAIRLANDTPYGLGANVWTGSTERGVRVAGAIRSGQVGVNRYLGGAPGAPWVGARQSGIGFVSGVEGHRQFTVPKSISYPVEDA
jgi:acyl-CoA reductase-like NAD-dependent aldehyde dehydrogenase